jgi:hypothetical protein
MSEKFVVRANLGPLIHTVTTKLKPIDYPFEESFWSSEKRLIIFQVQHSRAQPSYAEIGAETLKK